MFLFRTRAGFAQQVGGLAPAAARSLLAHLAKLAGEGLALREGEGFRAA